MCSAQRQDPRRWQRSGSEEDTQRSLATAGMTERDLIEQRLRELYDFNRGALYSNSLAQAQAAFQQGDFAKTLELVKASSELFEKRHKKKLEQDPRRPDGKTMASKKERLALEGKQSRIREILGIFDEVLKPLEKMAQLQRLGRPRPVAQSGTPGGAQPMAGLPDGFQAEYEAAQTADARHRVICRHFHVEPVGSDQDLRPDTLYYVRGKESHLIRSSHEKPGTDPVAMTVVPSGQPMKPVPRQKMLELGSKAQLLRLAAKPPAEAAPIGPPKSHAESVIDMGSFTQLLAAAQQSELLPNTDQIAHVRDREFRTGKNQRALAIIDRLSVKLNLAATQRQQKLRAEETAYKSGVLKMSPKEWQLKKQHDTLQTQKIERARRHFTRVLDGLRILMVSESDA